MFLICIAIARRKFIHINGYSLYKYWKFIAVILIVGNVLVTLSMMMQCTKGNCGYVYPSTAILQSSDNIFLETFGNWPGVALVVITLALQIFIRVIWSFYLPWPWSIYLMLALFFRLMVVGNAFRGILSLSIFIIIIIIIIIII